MLLVKRVLLCILAVVLGLLLGTSLVAAQVPPLVGRGPYSPGLVGVPTEAQVIDVRWSGDRRGEFTELSVLPPAFRGPAPAAALGLGFAPVPVSIPAPAAVPAPIPAPVPAPLPTPVPVPTVVLPTR